MEQKPRLQHFEENLAGRDFVVGDLHGYFTLLEQMLVDLEFDPRVDRLFSVGDCIDRGPENERVTEFLVQPWFHAIYGNHEALLVAAAEGKPGIWEAWQRVGGDWAVGMRQTELDRYAEALRDLPLVITIDTPHGRVGLVHADLPAERNFDELLMAVAHGGNKRLEQFLIWSREMYRRAQLADEYPGSYSPPQVAGVHRVYLGHNIVPEPLLFGNLMFIDTGAFAGGKLTMVELASQRIYQRAAP